MAVTCIQKLKKIWPSLIQGHIAESHPRFSPCRQNVWTQLKIYLSLKLPDLKPQLVQKHSSSNIKLTGIIKLSWCKRTSLAVLLTSAKPFRQFSAYFSVMFSHLLFFPFSYLPAVQPTYKHHIQNHHVLKNLLYTHEKGTLTAGAICTVLSRASPHSVIWGNFFVIFTKGLNICTKDG